MSNSDFSSFLDFIKYKKILLSSHDSADIDSIASCVSFKSFLKEHARSEVEIFLPEISKHSKQFIDTFIERFPEFDINFKSNPEVSDYELIIILDTNNIEQISLFRRYNLENFKIPIVFIDHHQCLKENIKENAKNLIFENCTSTSEIIFNLFRFVQMVISKPIKYLLLAGIITDSGLFRHANNDTLKNISDLLDDQIEFQEIFSFLKKEIDISERLAKIKGLQRVKIQRENEWLIGVSHVSSYEAEVASTLCKIGFDIGIVLSEKKGEFRISTRAKKYLCELTGLNLGALFEELSKDNNLNGGGHDGAASINGKENSEVLLNLILERIKQILNKE